MKKILCIALVVMMTLSLCACSAAGDKKADGLQVGYAREKLDTSLPIPLDGYGNSEKRISTGTLDPLCVTCVAFKEGEETVLLITVDQLSQKGALVSQARSDISSATGIPENKIMISFTHSHSTPDVNGSGEGLAKYMESYWIGVSKAAEDAIADMAPAKLYYTKTETENLNFVRHYIMNDGTIAGSNFGSKDSGYKDHATFNDPDMLLMKIEREEKKDILMMNWGAHPCLTGGMSETYISADFVGSCRVAVERDSDMLFAFYNGAAGNQNCGTHVPGEEEHTNYIEHGELLCKTALEALDDMQPLEGTAIKTQQVFFEANVCHEDEDKGKEAAQVQAIWETTKDRAAANALAVQLGLTSVYHANAVLGRPNRPQTRKMELDVISIGNWGIVFAPYEMFTNNSRYIKDNSPFDITMIFTLSNENYYYIPTVEAFEYGCYESYVAYFGRGEAERTADQILTMLKDLKEA